MTWTNTNHNLSRNNLAGYNGPLISNGFLVSTRATYVFFDTDIIEKELYQGDTFIFKYKNRDGKISHEVLNNAIQYCRHNERIEIRYDDNKNIVSIKVNKNKMIKND